MRYLTGYISLSVEGHPFWVNRAAIRTLGTGQRERLTDEGQPTGEFEVSEGTLIFVADLGQILVDQSQNEVIDRLEGISSSSWKSANDDGTGALDR